MPDSSQVVQRRSEAWKSAVSGTCLPPHLHLGTAGEDLVAAFFARKGYNILARNWHCRRIELDIICELDGLIVFVEVKTRSRNTFGGGAAAVNPQKRFRLVAGAQLWLAQNQMWQKPCRFDIVCIYGRGEYFRLEHYPDAFSPVMGCRHAYW